MRVRVSNPVIAARLYGGATWEHSIGWWSQSPGSCHIGTPFECSRDAIFVPTRTREGHEVSSARLVSLI